MRQIREMLRLHYEVHLTGREIERALHLSHATVIHLLRRFEAAGGTWPVDPGLTDTQLTAWLYPGNQGRPKVRPEPDWAHVHQEMRRKHVTLQLLWAEYQGAHPEGLQYSQFAARYRAYRQQVDVELRKIYHPGDQCHCDYAGDPLRVLDPATGAPQAGWLFVATLAYSNFTFIDLHRDQTRASWLDGHRRAFEYFGGVPRMVVPDNPKALVWDRQHDVVLDPSYAALGRHYHVGIVPARPRRPTDKAKAENHVLHAERWILAPLRDERLVGWAAARARVHALRDAFNDRPFQKLPTTRRALFLAEERATLHPLPADPYVLDEWRVDALVAPHYHIAWDGGYYSVPYALVGARVTARRTATLVEIYHDGQLVATHARVTTPGTYRTAEAHLPPAHAAVRQGVTPTAWLERAAAIGPTTRQLVAALLERAVIPEQQYPRCRGILHLAEQFSPAVLERAAARALETGVDTVRALTAFCQQDQTPDPPRAGAPPHDNLRGPQYFQKEAISHESSRRD
jgi:transposase